MHLEVDFRLSRRLSTEHGREIVWREISTTRKQLGGGGGGGVAMSSWFVIDALDAMLIATVKNGGLLLCQR